ncbi:MAG: hypothetical protein HQL64_00490 [Magnetococcales bacterium]|nr:hypothetical protein [Magnetococcales bacterium]
MTKELLQKQLSFHGLSLRGWFSPQPDEVLPAVRGKQPTTVVLVGNTGGSAWQPFSSSPEAMGKHHPFDAWTRRILEQVATDFSCAVCFPFTGPPFLPFPTWARRAEGVYDSPLGILVHPRFGLWHAYRGAFLLAEAWPPPNSRPDHGHPCAGCQGRPCLRSCPVGAFTGSSYRVASCQEYLHSVMGRACLEGGCLARHACPLARDAVYPLAQIRFHMQAFLSCKIA